MNNNQLRQAIQSSIRTNGRNEITGIILQQVLLDMVNTLGSGYQFAGVATPQTSPVVGDERLVYLAGPGDYSAFGTGMTVPDGAFGILTYDTAWHLDIIAIGSGGGGGDGMTVETFSGVLLLAETDKYYRSTEAVNTLTVQLPAISGNQVKSIILGVTMGNAPAVTFTAADGKDIRYVDGFLLKALGTYEINILYNGLNWTVAYVVISN